MMMVVVVMIVVVVVLKMVAMIPIMKVVVVMRVILMRMLRMALVVSLSGPWMAMCRSRKGALSVRMLNLALRPTMPTFRPVPRAATVSGTGSCGHKR